VHSTLLLLGKESCLICHGNQYKADYLDADARDTEDGVGSGLGRRLSLSWTLFASHGLVLAYIANNADATIREISDALGLTERQISRVLKELEHAEMIAVEKMGRRNCYSVNLDASDNHPALSHLTIGDFVNAVRAQPNHNGHRETAGIAARVMAVFSASATYVYGLAADAPLVPAL
jgi:DNA-binding transcriptional ArsR family regulator